MAASPNFLFLVRDQHRYDHLGCYGNCVVQTPTIDMLAESGWLSDAFHVASLARIRDEIWTSYEERETA